MAFLRGELDEFQIARWTEALSPIGWRFASAVAADSQNLPHQADAGVQIDGGSEWPDMAYVGLRTLLELESEWQGSNRGQWKKRRSQQPFASMCDRSPLSLASAVSDALRWVSIWGVPNPWGAAARTEKPRIAGRYIIRVNEAECSGALCDQRLADRLAAAVCIPLRWQDHFRLYQVVTLPPGVDQYREEQYGSNQR
jgi:CRISPR-associated protein Csx17